MKGIVCGIGINDANYEVKSKGQRCPFYLRWHYMLIRSTTLGTKVCDEWLLFSNFKAWMEKQDWEGKELDKDLKIPGNNEYSPMACLFIDRKLNALFRPNARRNRIRGVFPVCQKWKAIAKLGRKSIHIGTFESEIEAHKNWQKFMVIYLINISNEYESEIKFSILRRAERIKISIINNLITEEI